MSVQSSISVAEGEGQRGEGLGNNSLQAVAVIMTGCKR
jgi:hypothetical protein